MTTNKRRYEVTFEMSKWTVWDRCRNRVVDFYQDEETARRVADCFENINLLARKVDYKYNENL